MQGVLATVLPAGPPYRFLDTSDLSAVSSAIGIHNRLCVRHPSLHLTVINNYHFSHVRWAAGMHDSA